MIGPSLYPYVGNPTQYVDIACAFSNGFIAQNVSLPTDGIYRLSFQVGEFPNYSGAIAEIYWGGQLIGTGHSTTGQIVEYSLEF